LFPKLTELKSRTIASGFRFARLCFIGIDRKNHYNKLFGHDNILLKGEGALN